MSKNKGNLSLSFRILNFVFVAILGFSINLFAISKNKLKPLEQIADKNQISASVCFEKVAREYAIPVDILKSLAIAETQGFHVMHERNPQSNRSTANDHMKVYGIMGLRNDPILGFSLHEASILIGKSEDILRSDLCTNIRGAAAVLSEQLYENDNSYILALNHFWHFENWDFLKLSTENLIELVSEGYVSGLVSLNSNKNLAQILKMQLAKTLKIANTKESPKVRVIAKPNSLGGEFPGSDWRASPNYSSDVNQQYVVIHMTEGGFAGSLNWLTNPDSGVSAHYIVRARDGYTVQMVKESNSAHHARCWNSQTIGIEMEGFISNPNSMTEVMYRKVASLSKYLTDKYKIKKDNLHLIGHNFGSTGRIDQTDLENCNDHSDPGPHFKWPKFLNLVQGQN